MVNLPNEDFSSPEKSRRGVALADVAKVADEAKLLKARSLLSSRAVMILRRTVEGSVEATVQSEKGGGSYAVRISHLKNQQLLAICNCYDFTRRGGVCKHGVATLLHLIEIEDPSVKTGELHPDPSQFRNLSRKAAGALHTTPRRMSEDAEERLAKRSRPAQNDEAPPPPLAIIPKPVFPKKVASADSSKQSSMGLSSTASVDQKERGQGIKAALAMRLLQSYAASGNSAAFASELRKVSGPLQDTSGFLHRAVVVKDEVAGKEILGSILDRAEAQCALNATRVGDGRTLLHAAVVLGRVEICRELLERKADVTIQDSSSLTALDLARKRKIDVSSSKLDDPIVELLRGNAV